MPTMMSNMDEAIAEAQSAVVLFAQRATDIRDSAGCTCVSCRNDRERAYQESASYLMRDLRPLAESGYYTDGRMVVMIRDLAAGNAAVAGLADTLAMWVHRFLCTSVILTDDALTICELASSVSALHEPQLPRSEDRSDEEEEEYEEEPGDDELYPYSTDVLRVLGAERPGKALVFGVELEMECRSVSRTLAALGGSRGDEFICKYDGSLDSGIELVTLPMSLDAHRRGFGWKDILSACVNSGARSGETSTCGIHVHANKAALTALQIGKMLVFLNAKRNSDFVDKIAQRSGSTYAVRKLKKLADGKFRSEDRYEILNIGRATVEFRLFKGNLRPERVLKNLEFCHAIITYCADASIQELDVLHFGNWLKTRRGQYPNLVRFLSDAGEPRFSGMFNAKKDEPVEAREDI